jgi:hypothetical protein
MGEIINFRRAKKAKRRVAKEGEASVNRARFGTHKAERDINLARSEKAHSDLEGNKLDPDKPHDA